MFFVTTYCIYSAKFQHIDVVQIYRETVCRTDKIQFYVTIYGEQ